MRKNNGDLPHFLGPELFSHIGTGQLDTKPVTHGILGLDYYTKVTSPLRRYGDMIAHWQIEAALKQEAQTGRSLTKDGPRANRSFLPFSHTGLQSFMHGYLAREKLIASTKRKSIAFWESMLLFRATVFGELKLPFDTVKFEINKAPMDTELNTGQVHELNMHAVMRHPKRYEGMPQDLHIGDLWECKIVLIDMEFCTPVLEPVRLLHRWE